jgi:hypothetical protein
MPRAPYDEFTRSLNPSGFRIRNFPSLIFLCGGSKTEAPDDSTRYARDSFLQYLRVKHPDLDKRIILAEAIVDWFDDGFYDDLLSLEKDLAHLSVLTVLFVESPGSIAELGSFSLLEPVAGKLLPVFQNCFFESRSFIDLGPRRYLKKRYDLDSCFYPWNPQPTPHSPAQPFSTNDAANLATLIGDQIARTSAAQTFKFNALDPGHLMLLLADLVSLLVISRFTDLRELLDGLTLTADGKPYRVTETQLKQLLFLLHKLRIITKFPYGHDQYYLLSQGPPDAPVPQSYLHYSFVRGTRIKDRFRWQMEFRERDLFKDDRKRDALVAYGRRRGTGAATTAR